MVKANPEAERYVSGAPLEHLPLMKWIRRLMRRKLVGLADERYQNGMVVYGLEKRWLSGFAVRKKCVMFYVMDSRVLDLYSDRLGPLRSGKSCVEFRTSQSMSIADLKAWGEEVLDELRRRL